MSTKRRKKTILVVAPHPDDETLGCGGTLLKHKAVGDRVSWLIMTNVSQDNGFDARFIARRQCQIGLVGTAYAFNRIFTLNFSTTKLDTISRSELVKRVSEVMQQVKPEIIYVPFKNDVHSDHGVTFEVVTSATKAFRLSSLEKVLAYEVLSETEFAVPIRDKVFIPTSFSDITPYLERKVKIMRIYKEEIKKPPFPRSIQNIRALASFRGSTAGVKFAEAFMVIKERW